jgi:hypothetical protein
MKKFKYDVSKSDPDLHLLRVKDAINYLHTFDEMIKKLYDLARANTNLHNISILNCQTELIQERAKMVDHYADHYEASNILASLFPKNKAFHEKIKSQAKFYY